MTAIPAFLPLVLRWKPVGESGSQALAHAYCLLEVADPAVIALLERKVGEASMMRLGADPRLHIVARTDARGVLMTVPAGSAGAPDPLSLPALAPLLFPVATALKIWWTDGRQIFEEALGLERAGGSERPLARAPSVVLAFDDETELPEAIERTLLELEDGAVLRSHLIRSRDEARPSELLQLAEDGRTWCVELHDYALQVAVDAAWNIQELVALGPRHHFAAHQLLLAHTLDILRRRGHETDPFSDIVPKHEHLCAGEYRALRDDLRYALAHAAREVDKAGVVLGAVADQALHELSVHPYPEGDFERRGRGIVARRMTASLLLRSRAIHLQEALVAHFSRRGESSDARLLAIARGEKDPEDATEIEKFLAQTVAVLAWLGKGSSCFKKGAKLARTLRSPKEVEELTGWIDAVLAAAAQKGTLTQQKLFDAVTRGMRVAQVWAGMEPDFEIESVPARLALQGAPKTTAVRVVKVRAELWHRRFERAGTLLKLLNVIALSNALFGEDRENPSVLKMMTNLHGFVDGVEGTYRILSDTAETQLGISLKGLGKLLVPVSVYLSMEDTWSQLQAGDAIATLLAAGGVAAGILAASVELAIVSPHPAIKAAIYLAGFALAGAMILTTDDEEQFLEKYRPLCEDAGAYLEAKSAVSVVERALDDVEWSNYKLAELYRRLAK
jgi:hypothetical protein